MRRTRWRRYSLGSRGHHHYGEGGGEGDGVSATPGGVSSPEFGAAGWAEGFGAVQQVCARGTDAVAG